MISSFAMDFAPPQPRPPARIVFPPLNSSMDVFVPQEGNTNTLQLVTNQTALAPARFDRQTPVVTPTPGRLGAGVSLFTASSLGAHYPSRNFTEELQSLREYYTILDGDRVFTELLKKEPRLYNLMRDAVRPLKAAFGEGWILQARMQFSDDDTLLRVAVKLPHDFDSDPEEALRLFDQVWWLNNCNRSGGTLVFDYEIQDAV